MIIEDDTILMSDEFIQLKQVIETLLSNPQSANGLFNWLEGLHKQERSDINKNEDLLKTIETAAPEQNVLIRIARGINNTRKLNADKFHFVYAILQVLALRNVGTQGQVSYQHEKMISEKDRNALDWLSKYLEHKPGGADFE